MRISITPMPFCHRLKHGGLPPDFISTRSRAPLRAVGAKLIVVDPRYTATAQAADLFLQIEPGTDLALLNGLLNGLITRGKIDDQFVAEHTEGLEEVIRIVASYFFAKDLQAHRSFH